MVKSAFIIGASPSLSELPADLWMVKTAFATSCAALWGITPLQESYAEFAVAERADSAHSSGFPKSAPLLDVLRTHLLASSTGGMVSCCVGMTILCPRGNTSTSSTRLGLIRWSYGLGIASLVIGGRGIIYHHLGRDGF